MDSKVDNADQHAMAANAVPASAAADKDMPYAMPASEQVAKEDIARAGVEGEPGDAKSGPGMLRLELILLAVAFAVASILVGVFLSWTVGIVMLVWLVLALLVNPVAGAALLRIRERKQATRVERIRISTAGEHQP